MNIIADPTGGVTIGVDMAHYAVLSKDDAKEAPVYEDPVLLPNTKEVTRTSNDNMQTAYYDNSPKIASVSKGEKGVSLARACFSNEERRILLGFHNVNGITVESGSSFPPYVAFGFRILKSGGRYSYVWMLKGMFAQGEIKASTREQNISYQDQTFTGTFVMRNCDDCAVIQIDTNDEGYTAEIGEKWFTAETLNKLIDINKPLAEQLNAPASIPVTAPDSGSGSQINED